MPQTTLLNIAQEEQAQMLAALRRARYGSLLALHVLLLCAAGHTPTAIAPFLFCSRSSVSRIVRAYRAGTLGWTVDKKKKKLDGTLAAQLSAKHGIGGSAETVRRWLHELGWVWKRAKLIAKDTDPQRVARLACIRLHFERLGARDVMVLADARDSHLLPNVGYAWIPKGARELVMTPGQNAKQYLAGALNLSTGKLGHGLGLRKTRDCFGIS